MVNRRYKAGGGTLANFRSHRIRHGTATLLANNGMSIEGLAPQLGHTSTRVTARYGHRTTETIGRQTESAARASGLIGRGRRAA
jgi:integrase